MIACVEKLSATKLAWHGKEVRKEEKNIEQKKGERNPISVDESNTLHLSDDRSPITVRQIRDFDSSRWIRFQR